MLKRIGQAGVWDQYHQWGANQPNVIAEKFQMPENGWITHIGVVAGGDNQTARAKLGLWGAGQVLQWNSAEQTWGPNLSERGAALGTDEWIRMAIGDPFWVGFWRHPQDRAQAGTIQNPATVSTTENIGGQVQEVVQISGVHQQLQYQGDIPNGFTNYIQVDDQLAVWVNFVPNRKPPKPRWRSLTNSIAPIFSVYLDHDPEDAPYDYISRVHLIVTRQSDGVEVYNNSFEPLFFENAQGYTYERVPVVLSLNTNYRAVFRVMDSWGVWSEFADPRYIGTLPGPGQAVPTAPLGKINEVTTAGFRYAGTYSHPDNLSQSAVQVRVYNAAGTTVLYDSGKLAAANANVSIDTAAKTWAVKQFHAALAWGTAYQYDVRTWDSADSPGEFSKKYAFKTDSFPQKPTRLAPSGGQISNKGLLRCLVTDPDRDRITQVRFRVYNAAGTLLAGYPKTHAPGGGIASGETASLDVTADLASGNTYSWTAQAHDGVDWGTESDRATFFYAISPDVTMLTPNPEGLVNLVRAPSAEYGSALTEWEVTNGHPVSVAQDNDAMEGMRAWEINKTSTATDMFFRTVNRLSVRSDASRLVLLLGLKYRDAAVPSVSLKLECYNSAGALLGVVAPVAGTGSLNTATALTGAWQIYGNLLPTLPAGTVSVKPRLEMAAAATGKVRVDRWLLVELPAGAPINDFAANFRSWYGYFDGDTAKANEAIAGREGYGWNNQPGLSSSTGYNILNDLGARVEIAYASQVNSAKNADRIYIEIWDGLKWNPWYDSGWVVSNRTLVPIPAGYITNGNRYRIKVAARDSSVSQQVGETPWAVVDVDFEGPPELPLLSLGGNVETARLGIVYGITSLTSLAFGGYEIAIEPLGEPRKTVALITDPQQGSYQYPFPISNRQHRVWLRQIQVVGGERLPSRWSVASVDVDYEPYWWIKDVSSPDGIALRFDPPADSNPGSSSNLPIRTFDDLWGFEKPVNWTGEQRWRNGKISVNLFNDPNLSLKAEDQLRMIEAFEASGRTVCLLSHYPGRKRFVTITGFSYGLTSSKMGTVDIEWKETFYEEDQYLREGNPFV